MTSRQTRSTSGPWRSTSVAKATSPDASRRVANRSGETTGSALPQLPEPPVEPVVFLLHMVAPERFPLPVEVRRSQVQHRLSTVGMPTHPGSLQPVLDQVPTRPLDHSTADRIARHQVFIVMHPAAVPSEVADDLPHRLAA